MSGIVSWANAIQSTVNIGIYDINPHNPNSWMEMVANGKTDF